MSSFDIRIAEVARALAQLQAGAAVGSLETRTLDFKEEAGTVGRAGARASGGLRNEEAAKDLAEAAACFANSDGGTLVVGVDDKRSGMDALVGASLDADWLRTRVWELSDPHLTIDVEERTVASVRLLVLHVPRGFELHRVGRRIKHRVGTSCVEMAADEQRRTLEDRRSYDWSAEPTALTIADVSPIALERALQLLRASGESSRADLAHAEPAELLRRLGVMDAAGHLNRAGQLLFAAALPGERPALVYKRRRVPGGSSVQRIDAVRPVLEAFTEVKAAIDAANDVVQVALPNGVRAQIRVVPDGAVREAIVNAIMHRDYRLQDPVDIEFVGTELVVDSPGGFVTGIDERNILSHPSKPRNAVLTNALRGLRLAEQEGVGVDRMYRDMIRAGHLPPSITDAGGRVRCALLGGEPQQPIVELIGSLTPDAQEDVDIALIVSTLIERPAVDADELTAVLQKSHDEAAAALRRAESASLVMPTRNGRRGPNNKQYRFTDAVRHRLRGRLAYLTTSAADAEEYVVRYLASHDRIASAQVQELLGVKAIQASRILATLRDAEVIVLGSAKATGRGVFYVRGPQYAAAAARHGLA